MGGIRRAFQYEEIAKQIRQQILRGDFQGNGRLPSERVLGDQYQVQRNTIRQALALLEKDGHIWTGPKRGSFIKPTEPLNDRKTFLAYIHRESSPAMNRLVEGLSDTAGKAGYSVRRMNTDPPAGAAIDVLPDLEHLASDAAGVILWAQNPTDSEVLSRLNRIVPLVLVDRRVLGVSADCVRFDDVSGGRMVTEHLLDQGYERIAFLTDDVFAETVQHRWRGYCLALESAGVPINPSLSLFFHGLHEPFFSSAVRLLLSEGANKPTAIFCSNDLVAFTLLRLLRDEGIKVPRDVAVVGYGNLMPDYLNAMSLTSVDQSFFKLGQMAAKILLERVSGAVDDRIHDPYDEAIPVELIVRHSSDRHA